MCNSFDEWWNKKCASAIRVFTKQDCAKYIWEAAYAAGMERAAVICEEWATTGGPCPIAAEIREELK